MILSDFVIYTVHSFLFAPWIFAIHFSWSRIDQFNADPRIREFLRKLSNLKLQALSYIVVYKQRISNRVTWACNFLSRHRRPTFAFPRTETQQFSWQSRKRQD